MLVPLIWAKLKVLFKKSLGEIRVLINGIWRKFRNTNQYQLEDVID